MAEYAAQTAQLEQVTAKLESMEATLTTLQKENAARLAKAATTSEEKASPMSNMADVFNDPAMQGVIRQQIRGQVMSTFSDLLETFDLTRPEIEDLESMLTNKLMLAVTKGMKIMDKSLSTEERKDLTESMKEELEQFDATIGETYGDEIADKVKLYEESTSERQELTAFKSSLNSKGLEIPFETEEQLMAIMYEEHKNFDFTHNVNDTNDPSVLSNLNEDTFASIESEYAQLHERINARATEVLEGETLEAFTANQETLRNLMVSSMKMGQQMMGGGK